MATVEKPAVKAPVQQDAVKGLQERAVLVKLRQGCWSAGGVDKEVTSEIIVKKGASEDAGHFYKKFMRNDYPPLQKVRKAITARRNHYKKMTYAWDDKATRILPAINFLDFKKKDAELEQDVIIAVNEFCMIFRDAALEQKHRLKEMWKAENYPSDEEIKDTFRSEIVFEPIPSSGDFRITLSKAQADEIKEEYDNEVRARMKVAVHEVFANVVEVVEKLREQADKKDSTIQAKSFGPLRRLVATLPQLNTIVQDPQIATMAKQLTQELLSIDAKNEDPKVVKVKTKAKADALLATLKPLKQAWN